MFCCDARTARIDAEHVGPRQLGHRHLVNERLKEVVVLAVDDHHIHRGSPERLRRRETSEACADDHDARSALAIRCPSARGKRVLPIRAPAGAYRVAPTPMPRPSALARALDEAIGRPTSAALRSPIARLAPSRSSRQRALADAFAQACRSRGARADALALAMAHLSADEAPGATALEFLPVVRRAGAGRARHGRRGGPRRVRRRASRAAPTTCASGSARP